MILSSAEHGEYIYQSERAAFVGGISQHCANAKTTRNRSKGKLLPGLSFPGYIKSLFQCFVINTSGRARVVLKVIICNKRTVWMFPSWQEDILLEWLYHIDVLFYLVTEYNLYLRILEYYTHVWRHLCFRIQVLLK